MFDARSRYVGLPIKSLMLADGAERRYVARRFLPDPASLRTMNVVSVTDSDRLDLIANRAIGDPAAFWRIADANAAMRPEALLTPAGRRLRVPSPI